MTKENGRRSAVKKPKQAKVDVDAIILNFQSRRGPRCSVSLLAPAPRALVDALMAEPEERVHSTTIARALKHHYPDDVKIGQQTIRRHRQDLCSCR